MIKWFKNEILEIITDEYMLLLQFLEMHQNHSKITIKKKIKENGLRDISIKPTDDKTQRFWRAELENPKRAENYICSNEDPEASNWTEKSGKT